MEIINIYKSFNGKIFDTENECVKYEREMIENEKNRDIYVNAYLKIRKCTFRDVVNAPTLNIFDATVAYWLETKDDAEMLVNYYIYNLEKKVQRINFTGEGWYIEQHGTVNGIHYGPEYYTFISFDEIKKDYQTLNDCFMSGGKH
jgi:hypothetical protein